MSKTFLFLLAFISFSVFASENIDKTLKCYEEGLDTGSYVIFKINNNRIEENVYDAKGVLHSNLTNSYPVERILPGKHSGVFVFSRAERPGSQWDGFDEHKVYVSSGYNYYGETNNFFHRKLYLQEAIIVEEKQGEKKGRYVVHTRKIIYHKCKEI